MMRSTRVHAVFTHRYAESYLHHPHRPRAASRIIPFAPQKPHLTVFPCVEDPVERVFHASISEGRKSVHIFKFVADDYMVVESFLQKAFKRKHSLSAGDIADALEMDYGDVREALARMIKEGKLGVK